MRDCTFKADADKQADLIAAVNHAASYLDVWLSHTTGPDVVPQHRRGDIAELVTRLEAARDAVNATRSYEVL